MFLRYDWLVKHNPEINWDKGIIGFIKCLREYRTQYQDITFTSKAGRIQLTEDMDKEYQEISKESDIINLENSLEYIQLITHLFNKKKFKKLLDWKE